VADPAEGFLRSLGFPGFTIHHSFNHFDFTRPGRRILVIGPMGSGKTEYSARVWRDSRVALAKSGSAGPGGVAGPDGADRRRVFFVRSSLDQGRFPDYPPDALAYRGGYERCGADIARIGDSFDLERTMAANPMHGTWIIDEASFYDERLAYVVAGASERRGLVFVFPTLILNFRREIFNSTARLLLESATDIFPLTAYCEHPDCLCDSFYTYRFYQVDGVECPALYFDPLIIIGGDRRRHDPREPNYCSRCEQHHVLPGKEYAFLHLKPMGEQAAAGQPGPLAAELAALRSNIGDSLLFRDLHERNAGPGEREELARNALRTPCLAEKALLFLFAGQNLLSEEQFLDLAGRFELDRAYLDARLADQRRRVRW
jgi:thymidine kinase